MIEESVLTLNTGRRSRKREDFLIFPNARPAVSIERLSKMTMARYYFDGCEITITQSRNSRIRKIEVVKKADNSAISDLIDYLKDSGYEILSEEAHFAA